MKKLIKSTNPLKKELLGAFKKLTGANKVTVVTQLSEDTFQANLFKSLGNRKYESLGVVTIKRSLNEVGSSNYTILEQKVSHDIFN